MVAARNIVQTTESAVTPAEIMHGELFRLWSLISKDNVELIPGTGEALNNIHDQLLRMHELIVGQNAALIETKRQRDELLRESVELNHHGYQRANEEIIRDIGATHDVKPDVAQFLLDILTGAIDENGDYFVSTYAVNLIREAIDNTAGDIQEAIDAENTPLFEDTDDDDEQE